MQSPFGRPYDEDEDPDEEPRTPLELRSGYRSRADADERGGRGFDDRPSRTGLPQRPGALGADRKPPDKDTGKDSGGRFGLPFRKGDKDSAKSGPAPQSPFGVRGDNPRDEGAGSRKLPFSRGTDPDKKPDDKGPGSRFPLPGKGDSERDKQAGKKESGGKFGLPFGRGKDDKKEDRPARPAYPGGLPGSKPPPKEEKKGGLGGLLGRKDKEEQSPTRSEPRPGSSLPRRSTFDEDDRASRGFGSGAPRSSDSPPRSPLSGGLGDRPASPRTPLGGTPGSSDRSAFGSPTRSPLGDSSLPRRSPLGAPDEDEDDRGSLGRPSGFGTPRPADRALPGSPDRAERPAARSSLLGSSADRAEDAAKPRGGGLPGLPLRRGEDKAPAPPGPKANRAASRALPQTKKAPRIVKRGLSLDRKLDLIGVTLVGFALVVFFAVLPSMSFGLLPPVTGGLTGTINRILSQLFGWGKIVWPITSAVIGIWLMLRYFGGQMFDVDYFRVVGALVLYACALTWLHFFELVNDPAPTVEAFRAISYHVAVDLGEGGGWFGHQLYLILLGQLGDLGAVSVMVAWLVVGLMLTFDVSLVELGQFLVAILAAFNVSPAQRARKRAAQATAEASSVPVTRPGEAAPAGPRQMPLAPSTASAEGGTPAANAAGRSLPLIRRRAGNAEDEPDTSGKAAPAATPGATVDEVASAEEGGLFAKRRLPGLRRSSEPASDQDTGATGTEKTPGAVIGTAAAAGAGAGLGSRMGRFLRRHEADESETPEATPGIAEPSTARAATPDVVAEAGSEPAPAGDEKPAPDTGKADERPASLAASLTTPARDAAPAPDASESGPDAGSGTGDKAEDVASDEAKFAARRRYLPFAAPPDASTDEPAASASASAEEPPQRPMPERPIPGATPSEQPPERPTARALPFANPLRTRPAGEAPGSTPGAPAADRPASEDEPPRRRSLPFGSGPLRRTTDDTAAEADAAAPEDKPPVRTHPAPERSETGSVPPGATDSVRSFLGGLNLPPRPAEQADDADDEPDASNEQANQPDERGSKAGSLIAGAALAGAAALAGSAALSGSDKEAPDTAADEDPPPALPPRPARPFSATRPSAAADDDDPDLSDDDSEDEDEDDEDIEDIEEPLFDQPARPKGLVRLPQRPGIPVPPQTEPRPSDAGVRAANEFATQIARDDAGATRPSDDVTRRAPAARAQDSAGERPVSRTVRRKRIEYTLPDIAKTLNAGKEQRVNDEVLLEKARVIEDTLASFGAPGKVVEVNPGPVITQFGVEPDYLVSRTGKKTRVKVSSIARLDADLALALAAKSIRIEAPVPGKGFVGIEVPNDDLTLVALRDVIESPEFKRIDSKLAIALGLGVDGTPVAADLTAMPHLLIAGTTGSGKSVCVNAIITCLLVNNTPDDVKFIMVDPKRVELTGYNGIPHLVAPVVVDLERIVGVLQWVQREMEERYRRFAATTSRNILDYNRKLSDDQPKMPYLVVVVDELADLMMLAPDETERLLARLAQMARATGIHLIISTQRPSVDIITGLIKANFPARIAFAVASSVDSRVILDQPGAEKLLGRGDMLYQSPDAAAPLRMQGVFVSDEEINRVTAHWRQQALSAASEEAPAGRGVSFAVAPMDGGRSGAALPTRDNDGQPTFWGASGAVSFESEDDEDAEQDELYREAVEIVQNLGRASISLLQRRLRIGYTRAARLIDLMEQEGIVGPAESGSKPREVLKFD